MSTGAIVAIIVVVLVVVSVPALSAVEVSAAFVVVSAVVVALSSWAAPPVSAALELAPPGLPGWLLALGASLVPVVGGQIWLAMTRGRPSRRAAA